MTCFSLIRVHGYFLRVPKEEDVQAFGEIKQGGDCVDTLGHNSVGGTVGLFKCHDAGGNQVTRDLMNMFRHFSDENIAIMM